MYCEPSGAANSERDAQRWAPALARARHGRAHRASLSRRPAPGSAEARSARPYSPAGRRRPQGPGALGEGETWPPAPRSSRVCSTNPPLSVLRRRFVRLAPAVAPARRRVARSPAAHRPSRRPHERQGARGGLREVQGVGPSRRFRLQRVRLPCPRRRRAPPRTPSSPCAPRDSYVKFCKDSGLYVDKGNKFNTKPPGRIDFVYTYSCVNGDGGAKGNKKMTFPQARG